MLSRKSVQNAAIYLSLDVMFGTTVKFSQFRNVLLPIPSIESVVAAGLLLPVGSIQYFQMGIDHEPIQAAAEFRWHASLSSGPIWIAIDLNRVLESLVRW
jgi:hypothetical protein